MTRQEGAFEQLVRRTECDVRSYLAGCGLGGVVIDDLCQEVYLAYFRNPERRPAGVNELQWLKGIAKKRAQDHFRSLGRRGEHLRRIAAHFKALRNAQEADEDDTADLQRSLLQRCLKQLAPRARALIALTYEEEIPTEDIARQLRISSAAMRMQLLRVRKSLRRCIEGTDGHG